MSQKQLNQLFQQSKNNFAKAQRVLSFNEFIDEVSKEPARFMRPSADYLLDALNYFQGDTPTSTKINAVTREKGETPLHGQAEAQKHFYKIINAFSRSQQNNRLIVLHGPNGSAKSTFIKNLFESIEEYSHTPQGALYCFSWVFPAHSEVSSKLGFAQDQNQSTQIDSYAHIDSENIGAIVRSELHENPLNLIPKEYRKSFCSEWAKNDSTKKVNLYSNSFLNGELSHKNALIFETLLNEFEGDVQKVFKHVRIERLYLSTKFRRGLVSIEPKMGIDAHIRQVTLDQSMANLPPSLQSLNLFQLEGDLVDSNRGLLEFNDFLKRPVESFKYLLHTCETRQANLGPVVMFIDSVLLATSNERQLHTFREHPEFSSFKSRLELIRIPYLLNFKEEEEIYKEYALSLSQNKELAPHSSRVIALWAVLTRLKKPAPTCKDNSLREIIEKLTPIEKAYLYSDQKIPKKVKAENAKKLTAYLPELKKEHKDQGFYEGLLGASARELKSILQLAAQNDKSPTLGPISIFKEISRLNKKVADYDYLRIEPQGDYHNYTELLKSLKEEWLLWVDSEVRDSLALVDSNQLEKSLREYLQVVTAFVKKESVVNKVTGKSEAPNEVLMQDFEGKFDITGEVTQFRQQLIAKLGAWAVDNPQFKQDHISLSKVFPELIEKLKEHFRAQENKKLKIMHEQLLQQKETPELTALLKNMQTKYGYGPISAREAFTELVNKKLS